MSVQPEYELSKRLNATRPDLRVRSAATKQKASFTEHKTVSPSCYIVTATAKGRVQLQGRFSLLLSRTLSQPDAGGTQSVPVIRWGVRIAYFP